MLRYFLHTSRWLFYKTCWGCSHFSSWWTSRCRFSRRSSSCWRASHDRCWSLRFWLMEVLLRRCVMGYWRLTWIKAHWSWCLSRIVTSLHWWLSRIIPKRLRRSLNRSWSKRWRLHNWRLINNRHVYLWRWWLSLIWCFSHCLHSLSWWFLDHDWLSFNLTLISIRCSIRCPIRIWRSLDRFIFRWCLHRRYRSSLHHVWIKYIMNRCVSLGLYWRYFMLFRFENWRIIAKYWILVIFVSKVLNWFLWQHWSLLSWLKSLHWLLLLMLLRHIRYRTNILRIEHLISLLVLSLLLNRFYLLEILSFNLSRLEWHFRCWTLDFSLVGIHEYFMSNKGCLFIWVSVEMNILEDSCC